MTTFYNYPECLAEKWSNAGHSADRSQSASRSQSGSNDAAATPGPEKRTISLKLSNLPRDVTIQQLWKAFSPKGSVNFLEIYDARHRETKAVGRIDFAPPPRIDFWQKGRIEVALDGHEKPVTIGLQQNRVAHSSAAQCNPSIISMELKSLDFGSLLNKDTIVIGETINSMQASDLSLELNTHKGEITVQFQFQEKQRHISRKRQYKLITQVSAIKKV